MKAPEVEQGDWTRLAACKDQPSEIFFPERGQPTEPARQVCNACPVKVDCLEYALRHSLLLGFWGGLSEKERLAERRRRNRKSRAHA